MIATIEIAAAMHRIINQRTKTHQNPLTLCGNGKLGLDESAKIIFLR